ncbi:MAG: XRE family transcriptional regulator [Gammaproteobacteria bacterium]|nr:XRE family transcriptional regulator [Gammaproteobacteria bacterium]
MRLEELPLRGEPLRARLRELGMTQTDLADALGIRPQSVQHWVTGRTGPNSRMVPKLIGILKLDVDQSASKEQLDRVEDEVSQLREAVVALTQRLEQLAGQLLEAVQAAGPTRPDPASRRSKR